MITNCEPDKFWGQHLILNCKKGTEAVSDIDKVKAFVEDLIVVIDMEKHGDIKIDRFGEGSLVGISFCQFIKTSSIVGHLCDESKDFYLDIFSCKRFITSDVVACVRRHFNPEMMEQINIERGV
jgi:S-adenosylmethionine/arginine decarboxylase-like enzyme